MFSLKYCIGKGIEAYKYEEKYKGCDDLSGKPKGGGKLIDEPMEQERW